MKDSLVTIASFPELSQALVAKAMLENRGFEVYITDQNIVGMNALLSGAVGYVKLQVSVDDQEAARATMKEAQIEQGETRARVEGGEEDDCLACGARMSPSSECPNCGWTYSIDPVGSAE